MIWPVFTKHISICYYAAGTKLERGWQEICYKWNRKRQKHLCFCFSSCEYVVHVTRVFLDINVQVSYEILEKLNIELQMNLKCIIWVLIHLFTPFVNTFHNNTNIDFDHPIMKPVNNVILSYHFYQIYISSFLGNHVTFSSSLLWQSTYVNASIYSDWSQV